MKPLRPLRRGVPAPTVAGRYKERIEDFVVEEVSAYEPAGTGTHTWLKVEKRGMSTLDAAQAIARALGRRDREVGYAGLKDSHAVTRQWFSVEHVEDRNVEAIQIEGLRILERTRHNNKLKLGHCRANRFEILLRGVGEKELEATRQNVAFLAEHGVPNYFGEQRFGKRGANLDKGLHILQSGNPKKVAHRMPRRLFGLVVSAVQSEVFNRVLAQRIQAETLDVLQDGDVAWIHEKGACFVVEDAAAEQPRCDALEISPSGPLPGPEMLRPGEQVAAIEDAALQELGLSVEVFGKMPRKTHLGVRRALRIPLEGATVEAVSDGLLLRFVLPTGSYATTVLGELLTVTPWFATSGPIPPKRRSQGSSGSSATGQS